jgi:Leucine-rich repeat (LRR) protein
MQLLPDDFGQLSLLQDLNISFCYSLELLPASIGSLLALRQLTLCYLDSLQLLPETLGNLEQLETLNISLCRSLQSLPASLGTPQRTWSSGKLHGCMPGGCCRFVHGNFALFAGAML